MDFGFSLTNRLICVITLQRYDYFWLPPNRGQNVALLNLTIGYLNGRFEVRRIIFSSYQNWLKQVRVVQEVASQ